MASQSKVWARFLGLREEELAKLFEVPSLGSERYMCCIVMVPRLVVFAAAAALHSSSVGSQFEAVSACLCFLNIWKIRK